MKAGQKRLASCICEFATMKGTGARLFAFTCLLSSVVCFLLVLKNRENDEKTAPHLVRTVVSFLFLLITQCPGSRLFSILNTGIFTSKPLLSRSRPFRRDA